MRPNPSTPAQRRRQRAALAQRLLALDARPGAGAAFDTIDWAALNQTPDWLAWPDASLALLQCRVGALLHVGAMRLWIDSARVAAAQSLLGRPYLRALLALPAAEVLPGSFVAAAPIGCAHEVAPGLRSAGTGVLLAALPRGLLRRLFETAWAPVAPSAMAAPLAMALIERARALVPLTAIDADGAFAQAALHAAYVPVETDPRCEEIAA